VGSLASPFSISPPTLSAENAERVAHPQFGRSAERVPSLAEGFEAAAAVGVLRIEREPLLRGEGLDRNDVPGAGGDDVNGQDVDFCGSVGALGATGREVASADEVSALVEPAGGFDLDAPQLAAGVEDEVVRFVADGLADEKAKGGRFLGEEQFDEFATAARSFRIGITNFHGVGIPREIKKARADGPAPLSYSIYCQNSRLRGVNPPCLQLYFWWGIRELEGIEAKRGLDKIRAEFGHVLGSFPRTL